MQDIYLYKLFYYFGSGGENPDHSQGTRPGQCKEYPQIPLTTGVSGVTPMLILNNKGI